MRRTGGLLEQVVDFLGRHNPLRLGPLEGFADLRIGHIAGHGHAGSRHQALAGLGDPAKLRQVRQGHHHRLGHVHHGRSDRTANEVDEHQPAHLGAGFLGFGHCLDELDGLILHVAGLDALGELFGIHHVDGRGRCSSIGGHERSQHARGVQREPLAAFALEQSLEGAAVVFGQGDVLLEHLRFLGADGRGKHLHSVHGHIAHELVGLLGHRALSDIKARPEVLPHVTSPLVGHDAGLFHAEIGRLARLLVDDVDEELAKARQRGVALGLHGCHMVILRGDLVIPHGFGVSVIGVSEGLAQGFTQASAAVGGVGQGLEASGRLLAQQLDDVGGHHLVKRLIDRGAKLAVVPDLLFAHAELVAQFGIREHHTSTGRILGFHQFTIGIAGPAQGALKHRGRQGLDVLLAQAVAQQAFRAFAHQVFEGVQLGQDVGRLVGGLVGERGHALDVVLELVEDALELGEALSLGVLGLEGLVQPVHLHAGRAHKVAEGVAGFGVEVGGCGGAGEADVGVFGVEVARVADGGFDLGGAFDNPHTSPVNFVAIKVPVDNVFQHTEIRLHGLFAC